MMQLNVKEEKASFYHLKRGAGHTTTCFSAL